MKKEVKLFCIVTAITFVVLNAVVFAVPDDVFGAARFDSYTFWIGHVLTLLSYAMYVVAAVRFSKCAGEVKRVKKSVMFVMPAVSAVIGVIFGVIVAPQTVCIVGGVLSLALAAICVFIPAAEKQPEHSNVPDISFISLLTADAETLTLRATTAQNKSLANKVYEAIRFSDPVSVEQLRNEEKAIKNKYDEFKSALAVNSEATNSIADELILLIAERNAKCKVLK